VAHERTRLARGGLPGTDQVERRAYLERKVDRLLREVEALRHELRQEQGGRSRPLPPKTR
jgi:hypothetical protein